ncbi:MAG: transposase [Pyrinomonadaceae bacterium]|nr:transposase [Pyrinomonadaceae bacterium]
MIISRYTTELEQFRQTLYQNFNNRADTMMEVIDALCSGVSAKSPVELTLTACFRRSYSMLYKAIEGFAWEPLALAGLLAPYLPRPKMRSFWLLGVDVTPQPGNPLGAYARTLTDRGMVYQPNLVKGNKPITVGHQYSTVALLPEAEAGLTSSWLIPLLVRRIGTEEDKELVGAAQIDALLSQQELPFRHRLCVEVGDTSYSKPAYLCANRKHGNLVTIARARSNRIFYRQFVADERVKELGHPTWYGRAFPLRNPDDWPSPDEQHAVVKISQLGKRYTIQIQLWHNMLMPGKRKPASLPMHKFPFTLVHIVHYDDAGTPMHIRPLWLIVVGPRRDELNPTAIYHAYAQRYDLEHSGAPWARFGKQKLLLADFQTPETTREEAWWQLGHMAYAQLWMARQVANSLPRPWERNLPLMKARRISPTLVQRDFARIIQQLGTPAKPPKVRNKSPGRRQGTKLPPRQRHKVVVKGLL